MIHKSKHEVWPFNYLSNFKVRAMHRNHIIKKYIHFAPENLFIKYKIESSTNFVNKAENVHKLEKSKKNKFLILC